MTQVTISTRKIGTHFAVSAVVRYASNRHKVYETPAHGYGHDGAAIAYASAWAAANGYAIVPREDDQS